jgi:hypothetical protein
VHCCETNPGNGGKSTGARVSLRWDHACAAASRLSQCASGGAAGGRTFCDIVLFPMDFPSTLCPLVLFTISNNFYWPFISINQSNYLDIVHSTINLRRAKGR